MDETLNCKLQFYNRCISLPSTRINSHVEDIKVSNKGTGLGSLKKALNVLKVFLLVIKNM